MKCERCDKADQSTQNRVLLGVYKAALCNSCNNDWDATMEGHELQREMNRLTVQITMLHAMTVRDGIDRTDDVTYQQDKLMALFPQVRRLASNWVNE